jgi:hypothetical protein
MRNAVILSAVFIATLTAGSASAQRSTANRTQSSTGLRAASGPRTTTAPLRRALARPAAGSVGTRAQPASARSTVPNLDAPLGTSLPAIPAAYAPTVRQSIGRLLQQSVGRVAAMPGSTRESLTTMFDAAWSKVRFGDRSVSLIEAPGPSGGTLRTYYVRMPSPTGHVVYPPGARGFVGRFNHVVIQVQVSASGRDTLRSFEPGPPPGPSAQPVTPRVH